MHHMTIKRMASEFRVWRIIKEMKGEVTKEEIATEIGMHTTAVGRIISDNGWEVMEGRRGSLKDRPPVDVLMGGGLMGHD